MCSVCFEKVLAHTRGLSAHCYWFCRERMAQKISGHRVTWQTNTIPLWKDSHYLLSPTDVLKSHTNTLVAGLKEGASFLLNTFHWNFVDTVFVGYKIPLRCRPTYSDFLSGSVTLGDGFSGKMPREKQPAWLEDMACRDPGTHSKTASRTQLGIGHNCSALGQHSPHTQTNCRAGPHYPMIVPSGIHLWL